MGRSLIGLAFGAGLIALVGCGGTNRENPSLPTVAYQLYGLAFSPYLELDPNRGAIVPADRVARLLEIISPYCRWIRTYGATHGLENVPRLAKAKGLRVAAGCWLSRDQEANAREISSLRELIAKGGVDLAIVGTETLLRQDLSEDQLIAYLRQVKAAGVTTTTNDTWNELLSHPRVMAECDVVMANFHPYWEGIAIDQAVKSLHAHYLSLKAAAGGKEIIVGETGWPSAGAAVGQAVPSLDNAAFYFLNFVSWARAEKVKYFYFEAFDERWKAAYEGPAGAHWGIWDESLTLKPGMIRVFNGETIADNWSGNGPSEPKIEFTYVPPYGSFEDLRGKVSGVNPSEYKVAVYIYVAGWWTKPYWNSPLTPIRPDGTWVCDITTGGEDHKATRIAAYLVPNGYDPPLLGGAATLPAELDSNAVAKVEVERSPVP